ncbi:MAG: TRAP transporter large permease subunit [Azospirillum sp.]|nr:TRAP transporter large permease subunit [Azospirillum sp.]
MSLTIASLALVLAMLVLLASGLWVSLSLLGVGFVTMALFTHRPIGLVMATNIWGASSSWTLTALPLFIWMGEILFRSRLASDLFRGLAPWTTWIPGRLMHVNIIGCSIFAAVSGSSAATAATVGKMTIPELKRRGYDEDMCIASLAGAGTLGLLIPPSIILIVYGVAAEVSIGRLFIAGVIPGIALSAIFVGYVATWALLNPSKTPPNDLAMSFGHRLSESRYLIPVVLLIVAVLGSIYSGFATATEAAVLGVVGGLVLSAWSGTLDRKTFWAGLIGAARTSCMILFILSGAAFLTVAMGYSGLPASLAQWIASMGLSHWQLLAVLTVFFIVLGCFLDGISMVVLTTSVIMPMVEKAGIDLIWFGIYVVLVVEMAQITPPVGFNLFVLQGLTGRDLLHIGKVALPFFLLMLMMVVLITAVPELATWLPVHMMGR